MLKKIPKNFRGLIIISGPTKSGKSKLGEFLISEQESITYIATSKPRPNDTEWKRRIDLHKRRRPDSWKLIEHPQNICEVIQSLNQNESILIDSIGGLVEQHLLVCDDEWELFQNNFIYSLLKNDLGIIVVAEEIGWGIVPATPIGHLFRERHTSITSLISRHSIKRWLAINGTAIDIDMVGDLIP